MKKLKTLKTLLVSVLFISLLAILNFVLNTYTQDKKTYYLDVQSKLLQTKYETSYRYFKIMTSDVYAMYSQNTRLIALLAQTPNASQENLQKLRKSIYSLLKKNYKRLNHMGISQVHFYLPNNTSFLRMYKPDNFGDDMSKIKQSVVLTNANKQRQEGFEACNYMLGLRFVYPLYDMSHKHIASVEISYSTKEILKSITDDFVYDSHMLVSKLLARNNIIQKNLQSDYKTSWETDAYFIEESTHKKVGTIDFFKELNTPELRENITKGIQSKLAFSVMGKYNYQNIILSFLPVAGVDHNKNIAYIVVYTVSDYISNIEIEHNYITMLIGVVLSLLYLFSLYIIYNQENLKSLALYDNLTALPNRTLFKIELKNEINRALRYDSKIALLFLDLDGFKNINDTYGHHVGDELLINISNKLLKILRKTDVVARIGGDEFTVIIGDVQETPQVLDIANKIIKSINEEIIINNQALHVGVSIGIAIYPDHCSNLEKIIQYADAMMYKSKKSGKNRVTLYKKEETNV